MFRVSRPAITVRFFGFAIIAITAACGSQLPSLDSADHNFALRAFFVGLAAAEVGDDQRAGLELKKTVELAPGEPAAWNNLGVLQLRQRDLENASKSLETAGNLAPNNSKIILNRSLVAGQIGNADRAIELLNRAVELDPANLQARYLIAMEFERRSNDADAFSQYATISLALPDNVGAAIETGRTAAKLGKTDELTASIAVIEKSSNKFPVAANEQLTALKTAVSSSDSRKVTTQISYLRNTLLSEQWFRNDIAEFKPSDTSIGTLIRRPIVIPAPEFKVAAPDTGLTFKPKPVGAAQGTGFSAFYFDGDSQPIAVSSGERDITRGEYPSFFGITRDQIATIDFDYDFKNDLATATSKGFKLFRQIAERRFDDVTASTKLGSEITSQEYAGIWAADVEHDGDLDLVLAPLAGRIVVARNNADGSFTAISPFLGVETVRDFAYADLDEDGDSDAVFVDHKNTISIFANERGGSFELLPISEFTDVRAIAVADANGDGRLDLVAKRDIGVFVIQLEADGKLKGAQKITDLDTNVCRSFCGIDVADLDNNGANDIVIMGDIGTNILLADGTGFTAIPFDSEDRVRDVADVNGDGRLDLIGSDDDGTASVFENKGTKNYHWQTVRPRAAKTEGDQRVNSFGIGGEIEIRAGLKVQKQIIASPQVHFGLGEQPTTDVLRVVWANGYVQAEFDIQSDQSVAAEQRLKGSCPHLFAWNGEKFALVKDAPPWSPALGLKINAQDTYGVLQTEEWFKIPGDALRPRNGSYELRITGEYWETFYLDNYKLLVVDHPEYTEVFTDERFAVPLPPLAVFSTETLQPFSSAIDHNGRDVLQDIEALDEKYLDGIKRGRFQGVAEDHWIDLYLPKDAPSDKKLWLVADGWIHPTDASINVQRGQGTPVPPKSLTLEIQKPNGTWKVAKENLGFPAGKMKTILIDLEGVFPAGTIGRKIRLRTEMEIFWDRLTWAADIPAPDISKETIDLASAELRYRGFSIIEKANDSSPEKPDYDRILTTSQRWRDLLGYYTRFGDVKELLSGVDGRMVLMNAGDELVLKFPALPDVKTGWKRDFVIVGNGWIKDGDLNSVFSKTVLPLPMHENNDYSRQPGRLEADPVYRRFKKDWLDFHTRYVGSEGFANAARRSR